MSSVGQAVGMVVGGVIGFFAGGNVMLGASIGGAIGGYIDPPKGQDTVGPRLEDLTVQTSTYGSVLPRVKGTIAVTGNIFWLEGDKIKEHKKTKKVGGKGGGGQKQTTFSYSATFAVGLSHQIAEPITGIRRLWIGNKLVFESSSGNLESIIASVANLSIRSAKNSSAEATYNNQPSYAIYYGSDDQQPDPRMQADKGIANVSGYPGRCHIVFYDLDLTEHYNNTLMAAQVKVELSTGSVTTDVSLLHTLNGTYGAAAYRDIFSAVLSGSSMSVGAMAWNYMSGSPAYVRFHDVEYGVFEGISDVATPGYEPSPSGSHCLTVTDCDVPVVVILEGLGYYSTQIIMRWYYHGSVVESLPIDSSVMPYHDYTVAVAGAETFFALFDGTHKIYKWEDSLPSISTAANYAVEQMGISESYLFGVFYTASEASTTTVYKFDRETLDLLDTYTQTADGQCATISVVSDTLFYTMSIAGRVYKWENGVVVNDFGVVMEPKSGGVTSQVWFEVFNESPFYGVSLHGAIGADPDRNAYMSYAQVSATPAKLRDIVTEECALAGIPSSDIDLTGLVNSDVRGYRVSSVCSVRSVLEQLQAAFPFDVIQSGYKVKFKSRGGASVVTVPEADLGAHTGNDTPSRFVLTTEMPSQVPAKVTFSFLNADREYDPDQQSAAFTAQDVKNSYTVSLPLVMTPTEALQAADVLLRKEQVERTVTGTFYLPPSDDYRKLEAADVIDVVAQGRTYTVRLTKVTQLADGRVECDGKLTASAAYTSTALAQDSLVTGQTLVPLVGSSRLVLLDIPRMSADQDVYGLVAGMYGFTSAWTGGIALRSDDSGETFNAVSGFDSKTEVFTVSNTPATVLPYTVDTATALTATPVFSGADLFSITETQLYAFGNVAAYGADGRWEIVAFKTVVDNTGTYAIRDLLRGLYGTEWAMALHAADDNLVMLDYDALEFIGMPATSINSPRLWRGVTSGAAIDSATDIADTYEAINFKPYAPVDFTGWRTALEGNWIFSFEPRSRTPVELFSGLSTPSDETVSSYELDIYSNSGFSVVVRTLTSSTPSFSYSAAQQTADFGSVQLTLYVKGYQVSSAIGRGFPLTATISRDVDADPYLAFVTSLLHFEGANGSTVITDVIAGNAWTASGNAQLTTTDPLYGGSSLLLDGASDYVRGNGNSGLSAGLGDFTLEFSYTPASLSPAVVLVDFRPTGTTGPYHQMDLQTSGVVRYMVNNIIQITGTVQLVAGTRARIAVSRVSGITRLFVEGVLDGTFTDGFNYSAGSGRPVIGANGYVLGNNSANGKFDEWRYTKAGRYSGNYTPQSAPFMNP